jgi:hypothetical protein
MHLKVFLKLKNPRNSLFWEIIYKKKTKKPKKKPKNPKKTHWAGFFYTGFFQPCLCTVTSEGSVPVKCDQIRNGNKKTLDLIFCRSWAEQFERGRWWRGGGRGVHFQVCPSFHNLFYKKIPSCVWLPVL